MGANFTRRVLTVGLIGASLAAAAPAGAVVVDKNIAVRHENAVSVSSSQTPSAPRITPPNVARALRSDANPAQSPAPSEPSAPRMTPPNVQRTLVADAQPFQSPSPVNGIVVHSGFDWSDAAIGAAGMLGLLAMAGCLLLVAQRRRQPSLPITG